MRVLPGGSSVPQTDRQTGCQALPGWPPNRSGLQHSVWLGSSGDPAAPSSQALDFGPPLQVTVISLEILLRLAVRSVCLAEPQAPEEQKATAVFIFPHISSIFLQTEHLL